MCKTKLNPGGILVTQATVGPSGFHRMMLEDPGSSRFLI